MAPHPKGPEIHSLDDVRREMGDEITDEALEMLRSLVPFHTKESAIETLKVSRVAGDSSPETTRGVASVALALLIRGFVSLDNVPDDPVYDGEPVSSVTSAAVVQKTDEEMFPRSLGPLWKLQACLRLSKTDTNGLEILQTGVTNFLLNNGISEPGLQANFDAQQEMMKE